jgi:flagellar hook-associated protein 3 FlgL
VQTPADDPVAAVHILELERALQASEQYGKNADMALNRLSLEEQSIDDVGTLLQRVRELTVQGNNATLDAADRRMVATELRGRLQDLVNIANRRDANGEFLFSGFASLTQPFAQTGASINYYGDQGVRQIAIGPNQTVTDSHSGFDVFMNVAEGNGVFVTGASNSNTGSGAIGGGSVVNLAAWVPEDYTLRFTSATGDYQIVDSNAAVVATGVYTANSAISFNGVNVNMTGMPAMNDTFTIARSRTEDVFTTLNELVATLEGPAETQAQRGQFNSRMASALTQIDSMQEHLSTVRAQIGSRLSGLEAAQISRESQDVELQRMTSELRDIDYAEALTRMNQQLVGLQAAQASYTRIAQLSLFNYLR